MAAAACPATAAAERAADEDLPRQSLNSVSGDDGLPLDAIVGIAAGRRAGGACGAVGMAVGLTIFVMSRRRKKRGR